MIRKRNISKGERGNAVALTLLGLAVAILAGVVVLYVIGKSSPQPAPQQVADKETFEQDTAETNPREGWRSYVSEEYGFTVEFPQGWVVATGTLATGDPVVSIFQALSTSTDDLRLVYSPQDVASHVSIYPLGVSEDELHDKAKASQVVVAIPQAFAKDYILGSGKAWATKASFEKVPENWSEKGFVFTRVIVEEEELLYMRDEVQIAEIDFDATAGDYLVRNGFIDSNIRTLEEEILRSFQFTSHSEASENTEEGGALARIDSPLSGELVTSPLTVQGVIFGKWYFKDDMQMTLETDDGQVLTQVPIVSSGGVGEDVEIPFNVSVVFENNTATSGKLVIHKVSGGVEGERLVIPVLFAQ